jgi:aspartyl-tRNA(Asn)/glutamyl-tRNA(Gln) amidotransferase subunit C
MKLSLEQVRHVARLARLRLSPQEEQRYARQLSEVLGYFEALREVDTSAIAPTAYAQDLPLPLREDAPAASLSPDEALANAPRRSGTSFAVPRIIE